MFSDSSSESSQSKYIKKCAHMNNSADKRTADSKSKGVSNGSNNSEAVMRVAVAESILVRAGT